MDIINGAINAVRFVSGAQPQNQEEVLNKSKLFATKKEAEQYVLVMDFYEKPDTERMIKAIEEIKL